MRVRSPIGIWGPSIDNGMIHVPTTVEAEIAVSKTVSIVASGLPPEDIWDSEGQR